MPYTAEHKRDTRRNILESAFAACSTAPRRARISIDEIMDDAGLTRGGFYRHFQDKAELYAEAVRWFLCEEAPKPWQRPRRGAASKSRAERLVDAYFSRDHFEDCETCCPMIGLAADVSTGPASVQAAYQEVLKKLVEILQADLTGPDARQRALSIAALCVGGMLTARSVVDSPPPAPRQNAELRGGGC